MFKYKNVMIALFALFFFSTSVHFIYSCLTLEPNMRNTALLCDCVLFMAPLAVFISGKLRRVMPYIFVSFYAVSCFVMSVINKSELYLPLLFACAVVCCGFFLSVKLCIWHIIITDLVLIWSVVFFLDEKWDHFMLLYFTMCVCYNFSAFAMTLFVYAVRRNLIKLRRRNKELSVSDNRKNAFWAAAASQMRLASDKLNVYCASRLEDDDLPDLVREKISTIKSDTKHLITVLNDAEDYAMIENKRLKTSSAPYSFGELVNEIADSCSMLITVTAGSGISYSIDCQPDIPAVLIGDMDRIIQVIMNLFENAAKYTENGSVSIAFSSRKTEDGVNLQIRVTDTGVGFTDSAARRMFTVYADKRGHQLVSHVGLAIVKELVTLMGGFVYARRLPTCGTGFVITLPQGVKDPVPFAEIRDSEKISALIYVKEKSSAERICGQLEKMGVKSNVCLTRTEFSVKKDAPELTHIFTDYSLYNFDSPVFRILSRRLIIVVLCDSGEGSEIMPQNVRRLSKPVNMAAVSRIMNETVLDTVIKDSSDPDFDPRRDIHYDDPRR
ncbi:MAG: HAMP domain-containing histidine kinase [Ruminiclostridium sp.]|nr:HAMP domain-containing histidine kinase [Ruminiclostridium sp.]